MDTYEFQESMINEMNERVLKDAFLAMIKGEEAVDNSFIANYLANVGLCSSTDDGKEIIRSISFFPQAKKEIESYLGFYSTLPLQPEDDGETILAFMDLVEMAGLAPFLGKEKLNELIEMVNRNIRVIKNNSERFACLAERAEFLRDALLCDKLSLAQYFVEEVLEATSWIRTQLDRPISIQRAMQRRCWSHSIL